MPKTPLFHLAKMLGLSCSTSDTLFEVLKILMVHIFPKMRENDIMAVLRQRTLPADPLQDLLEVLEKEELAATDDDQRDIKQVQEAFRGEQQVVSSFTQEFLAREKASSKGKPKPLKTRSGKQYPDVLRVRDLLPPDESVVFCDKINQRWQLFWPSTRQTRSNAFLKHGFQGAALLCVAQAWREWVRRGGTQPPFPLPA